MIEPRPMDYLQPGEEPVLTERRHPLSIVGPILSASFMLAVFLALSRPLYFHFVEPELHPYWITLAAIAGFLWLVNLVALFYRMRTSRYVVTPERVYRGHGRLRFQLLQTTYDKVTDLHVRQGPLGRLWGYGDVTVMTAGTGLTLDGVPDPIGMKRRVEETRTEFLNRLLEEYRLEHAVEREPAPVAGREGDAAPGGEGVPPPPTPQEKAMKEPVWRGRPVLVSLVGTSVRGVFLILVGLFVLRIALEQRDDFLWWLIAGGATFIGVSTLVGGWIQYQFTRYEVHDWGVVVTSGWLTRRRVEVTYDKVTDVVTYQGFMGRLFNYGNITVNTAGSNQAPVIFAALDDPEEVKGIVDETRRRRAEARRRGG